MLGIVPGERSPGTCPALPMCGGETGDPPLVALPGSGSALSSSSPRYEDMCLPHLPASHTVPSPGGMKAGAEGDQNLGAQPACCGALGPSLWPLAWISVGMSLWARSRLPVETAPAVVRKWTPSSSTRQMISRRAQFCPGPWLCTVLSLLRPVLGSAPELWRARVARPSQRGAGPRSSASSELHLRGDLLPSLRTS